MAKVKFTAGRIAEFSCAEDKPAFLWDSETPGLGLRASPGGAKAFIFQAKLQGEVIRIKLGRPSDMSCAEARAKATEHRKTINEGRDPRKVKADRIAAEKADRAAKANALAQAEAERQLEVARRELLARTAWDAYLAAPHKKWGETHRNDHIIAAGQGGVMTKIGNRQTKPGPLATLLNLPLYAISSAVVQDWLNKESSARPVRTRNAFRKFQTFIRWCLEQSDFKNIVQADCCFSKAVIDIVPAARTRHGDCLQREQLRPWFEHVRKIANPVISAYLQSLPIVGARRDEWAELRWKNVDFQWRSLTIRDKIDGWRTIPLTPHVSSLLAALPRNNEWVFSSPTAKSGHITEPRKAHVNALVAARLPHVSLQGLRRTFLTQSEWLKMPPGVAAQIMGHKPSALAEKHYHRRPLDLLRMWHDQYEAWILAQAGIDFIPEQPAVKNDSQQSDCEWQQPVQAPVERLEKKIAELSELLIREREARALAERQLAGVTSTRNEPPTGDAPEELRR
jgi:integrase